MGNLTVEKGLDVAVTNLESIFMQIAKLKVTLKAVNLELKEYFVDLSGRIHANELKGQPIQQTPPGKRMEVCSFIKEAIEEKIKLFAEGKLHNSLLVLSNLANQIKSVTSAKAERQLVKDTIAFVETLIEDIEETETKIGLAQNNLKDAKRIIEKPIA